MVVAVVALLVLTAFQYEQTSSLQDQINTLQAQINGIPDDSAQIYQIQQELSNLESHTTTTTTNSSSQITALCVDVSQACVNATGDDVFFLSVGNTGFTTIAGGPDNTVSFKGVNGTNPFQRVSNVTIPQVPPGGSASFGLTSWQSVFGAGIQPPFARGDTIMVSVCLWETTVC